MVVALMRNQSKCQKNIDEIEYRCIAIGFQFSLLVNQTNGITINALIFHFFEMLTPSPLIHFERSEKIIGITKNWIYRENTAKIGYVLMNFYINKISLYNITLQY